ncbi:MAG: cadmium-translocating P-type ATPase [Ruminiclostridium sp.]|nr:cadmium-translocating P-type ATPase [Ruminiclostridium sp.]
MSGLTKKQKNTLLRIVITFVLFAGLMVCEHLGVFGQLPVWLVIGIFVIPYLLIGYDIMIKAAKNIAHGQVFDENLLMLIATVAAFCIGEYSEAVAVMLFYQVGELFQSYAVGKARRSITDLMDIVPEYANLETGDGLEQTDPDDVEIGSVIVIKAGERIPLDGVVIEGETMIDTAALTGESVPRRASVGDEVISGCINGSGTVKVRTTKAFEDSTVSRILELVENAGNKKARVENFITRFAKIYTPAVTICAVLLAVIPPLVTGGDWGEWIRRACCFLVISCPCALVISVPLGFFGGIGAASRSGILVKGGNYLEAVSNISTVVFDKTGTLTKGEFKVTRTEPTNCSREELMRYAAHAESFSDHPIALSVREAYTGTVDTSRVANAEELAGHGISADVDGKRVVVGNRAFMQKHGISAEDPSGGGTVIHTAADNKYLGTIIISDSIKPDTPEAIRRMKQAGIKHCVMLTGDREAEAKAVAEQLGLDGYYAQLLPADKVEKVEKLLKECPDGEKLAFVGDGINDAPVLARADIGIAMGSMGSDAAIEAADIVIMDDDLRKIPLVKRIAAKTMRIVRENIVFALAVKLAIMVLGAFGIADMWLAVFADVGVAVIAILNSMRTLAGSRERAEKDRDLRETD